MSLSFDIVEARTDKAGAFAELHKKAFNWAWGQAEMHRFLADPSILTLAALSHGNWRLVGFIIVRIVAEEAEILTIAVEPKARRSGIGEALCETAMAMLRGIGIHNLFLEVSHDNERAVGLYEKLGFHEVGRRTAYYRNKDGADRQDALILWLDLT